MNPRPTIGRIVHYLLSESDCEKIMRRRADGAYIGIPVDPGEKVAMIVTRVGLPNEGINGRCVLDGTDEYWVTEVFEGEEPGTWQFSSY